MLFQPFDEQKPVRTYYTNMPHWRQEGCTYFVTYRLADSIPESVLREWEFDKLKWIQPRVSSVGNLTSAGTVKSSDNKRTDQWYDLFTLLSDADKYQFLKRFNRKLNTYLDGSHGSCILRNSACAKIVLDGWEFFAGKRYKLGDLIVMPNHVHVLLTPQPGFELEQILQGRKRQSARQCNQSLNLSGAMWQKHSYDHIVRDVKELIAFQGYIASNPEKTNLRADEYLFRPHEWKLPALDYD